MGSAKPKSTRNRPCPNCNDTTGRCLVHDRNGVVSGCDCYHPSRGTGWGHLQQTGDTTAGNYERRFAEPPHSARAKATSGEIDRVCSAVMAGFPLPSERLWKEAASRGFTPDSIATMGLGYLPPAGPARNKVVDSIKAELGAELLLKTPLFSDRYNRVSLVAIKSGGLLFPYRDSAGNTLAIRFRPDEPGDGGKYRWLSGGQGGSVEPVAYLAGQAKGSTAAVLEGEFKAVAASEVFGTQAIGLPGVSGYALAGPALAEHKIRRAILANDANQWTKREVGKATVDAAGYLRARGLDLQVAVWWDGRPDADTPDGIDDARQAGSEIRLLSGEQVDKYLAELAAHHGLVAPEGGASEADEGSSVFSRALACAEAQFTFFSDNGIAYMSPGNGVAIALEGSSARRQLILKLYRKMGKAPSAETVQKILDVKGAEVTLEGPFYPVFRRVGEHEGFHYLDLCRVDGTVVQMSAAGWSLMKAPPGVFFRRSGSDDEALPDPVRGGDVMLLADVLNAPTQAIKFTGCYVTAALRTGRPYPLLVFEGGAGSAKTSATKILKYMIDPERAMVSSLPKNEQDLAIACYSSHLLVIDNVDRLKPEQQDALCRVATGAHHKARKLYADAEQTALDMHAPVIMSGIDGIVDRADLGSRVALVTLDNIPEDKRKTEDELWALVRQHRPHILGGLLDAFVAGLANLDKVRLSHRPRMIDFAQFITAAEAALPWGQGEALAFFQFSQANLFDQALGKDRVALAIIRLMQYRKEWTGTVAELLDTLVAPAGGEDYWPTTAHKLSRRVIAALPLLESRGIGFRRPPRSKHGVLFSFYLKEKESALSTPASANPDEIRAGAGELMGELSDSSYTKYTNGSRLVSQTNGRHSTDALAAQLELEEREERRALLDLSPEDIPL